MEHPLWAHGLLLADLLFVGACSSPPPVDSTLMAPVVPKVHTDFYVGHWEPVSAAYQGMGWLVLDPEEELHWHGCTTQFAATLNSSHPGTVLKLAKACKLDDMPATPIWSLRVEKIDDDCDMRVSAYASDQDMMNESPAVVGLYARALCHL